MNNHKTKKKSCKRCEKVTEQANTSEGFAGTKYMEDWTCTVCGSVDCVEKKGDPKFVTEFCVNTGGY